MRTHLYQVLVVLGLSPFFVSQSATAQLKLGDGSSAPHPSAVLELESTNKGFLPPRMTTSQRDAIAEPANGMVIYNTTLNCLQLFSSGSWICLAKTEPAPTYPLRLSTEEIEVLPSPKRGDLAYDLTFDCLRVYNGSKWGCSYNGPGNTSPASMAWKAGGTGYDSGNGVAVDGSGNIYVTGKFEGSVTFGSTTLTSSGSSDVFVVKYNGNGIVQWAQKGGGANGDAGMGIAVDGNGNVYVTGTIPGTATFGHITLTPSGGSEMFIAKYNNDGNLQWAQKGGASTVEYGNGVAVDGNGNVYVTGNFYGTATFGSTTLTSSGSGDVFVVKYSGNGIVQWAQKGGGAGADAGQGIAVDKDGYVYVTGYIDWNATFGYINLYSSGSADMFLVKYSSDGVVIGAQRDGGSSADYGRSIAADNNGNVFVTGYFSSTATFGSTTLTSSGSGDVFVVKYNSSWSVQWAQKGGGNDMDMGQSIAVDNNGNVFVTGYFKGIASFGSTTLASGEFNEMFIVKYNNNGNVLWGQRAGANNAGQGIAADNRGNVYVTGPFYSIGTYGSTTLTSSGGSDVYVQWFKE